MVRIACSYQADGGSIPSIAIFFISDYRLTVRTLVFHSSNVGSIPSNPIMNLVKPKTNTFLHTEIASLSSTTHFAHRKINDFR